MFLRRLALALALLSIATATFAQTATTTRLAINSGGTSVTTVKEGTEVILTATVTLAGGSAASPPGQVNFCDVAAAPLKCTDIRLLGTAQLSGAGTAAYRFFPGAGTHSYQAIFLGTNSEAASSSLGETLVVSPYYPTSTVVVASGIGDYTLTATVTTSGGTVPPTGTVSFLDTSNSNHVLGEAPLIGGPASFDLNYQYSEAESVGNGYSGAECIAFADFNGDGILDLVEGTGGTASAAVLLGSGHGAFTLAPILPLVQNSSPTADSVVAGDFNGDGYQDIAVAAALNSTDGPLQIMLGNGDGTFRLAQSLGLPLPPNQTPTKPFPEILVTADFNGDGIPDLAVSNGGSSNTVTVLLGNGDGTFTVNPAISVGFAPAAIAVADFNGDGRPDLAVAVANGALSNPPSSIIILLGNGDGTFTPVPSSPVTGYGAVSIAVGDFNLDGKPDLAVVNAGEPSIAVLLGNGDGTFTAAPPIAVSGFPNPPASVAVGDFNLDGKPDLITSNEVPPPFIYGTVSVLLGNGDGTFAAPLNEDAGEYPGQTAIGDYNGDGLPDIAVAGSSPASPTGSISIGTITVLLSQLGTQSATATITGISVVGDGSHFVDASYSGDVNYQPSVSDTIPVTAIPVPTALTFTASPGSSGYGQQVTLTATISPDTAQDHSATGTVTFMSGSTVIGTGTVANGIVTFSTTYLASGTDNLTATYSGDINFDSSTASLTFIVSPLASATTLAVAPNPAGIGQVVTLMATVSVAGVGRTGTVTFFDGATQLAQVILDGTGHASYSLSTLALGPHLLTAVYSGNAAYAASTSATVAEVIETTGFTMALSNTTVTLQTHQHTTLTVTLTSIGDLADQIGTTCGSLPTYVTCIFTPNPAPLPGNGTTAVSFYLDTNSILGDKSGPLQSSRQTPPSFIALALLLPPLTLFGALGCRRRKPRRLSLLLLIFALVSLPLALSGCGSSVITPIPSAAPGTYTIPITATGTTTGLTHTTQLTLTVTP